MFEQTDKTVAARIAEGDPEAENYLFSLFKERIRFLVRIRLKGRVSVNDQKDIISEVQQAILISLRKGSYDHSQEKPLEAYIAGIAGNVVAQYFRKIKKEKPIEDIEKIKNTPNQGNALSDLIDEEHKVRLRNCLKKLKQKYKEVLILRIYENKSIEEIANHLNLEKRRVSERINYAFKLFLKEYKKDEYFQ